MTSMNRPIFSGHETFACKSHWLKRGYDFVQEGKDFNDEKAVVYLGVGKNMVASIRYWMKAFGLLDKDGKLTPIAHLLLTNDGYDPYFEDLGSLWLMHFNIINEDYATAYRATFVDYHSQRNVIEKNKLQNYIKHKCFDNVSYRNQYNENTVKKDVNVLIHNYYNKKRSVESVENSNTLLAPLSLLREAEEPDMYVFNYASKSNVPAKIFLYALLISKQDSKSISFEAMSDLALMFCLTNNDLLAMLKQLCEEYFGILVFSDVAGIKELQIKSELLPEMVLKSYYTE